MLTSHVAEGRAFGATLRWCFARVTRSRHRAGRQ
uniref:Uncharacterized protein n=1 Tax=Arundo donax TaxID=35708 RepID=A0A0A9HME6_ARUDO